MPSGLSSLLDDVGQVATAVLDDAGRSTLIRQRLLSQDRLVGITGLAYQRLMVMKTLIGVDQVIRADLRDIRLLSSPTCDTATWLSLPSE